MIHAHGGKDVAFDFFSNTIANAGDGDLIGSDPSHQFRKCCSPNGRVGWIEVLSPALRGNPLSCAVQREIAGAFRLDGRGKLQAIIRWHFPQRATPSLCKQTVTTCSTRCCPGAAPPICNVKSGKKRSE